MHAGRAAALALFLFLAAAPPAAASASKRAGAHAILRALQPKVELTAEQREAIVADQDARAASVAATCLDTVQAAVAGKRRADMTGALYYSYVTAAQGPIRRGWQRDSAKRLAALQLHARVLRRGIAARARFLRMSRQLEHAMPADFCAALTAWQASKWKDIPLDVPADVRLRHHDADRLIAALDVLMNHGGKLDTFVAWLGEPSWPDLREPAPDPILKLLAKAANPRVTDPDAPGRSW